MKYSIIIAWIVFLAVQLHAQDYNLTEFPKGSTPEEIGTRISNKYLGSSHSQYGNPRPSKPPTQITYPDVCTWLGGLWFADVIGNMELYTRFVDRFQPLFTTEENLHPKPNHVDNNVFGAIPLEIYQKTKEKQYLDLGLMYADTQWNLPEDSKPEEKQWADKGYSWQTRLWIDDMFMITAVQAQAYLATGDRRYIDRAASEMVLYLSEIQRDNGLFYHSPTTPFFWGRGNGWMAVGMTEILRMLPGDNPHKKIIMEAYKKMMATLLQHQAEDGMWRQLVDDPDSWKETSCTGMFTYAFITGVKNGWLDEKTYGAAARKAWLQLITYINENDEITEVCAGTNIKDDYQYYLDRPRIVGDLHGQAPIIWCAYALKRISFIPKDGARAEATILQKKADGFKGIWYMNQPSNDEYVYKYSGGLGVYPANHRPFAIYRKEVDKTFFCFGGTDDVNSTLYHNISCFDHKTGLLEQPTILLDKGTTDAHDNPVISMDDKGYIWIFSTSHGVTRPSYIHKSKKPYQFDEFETIHATEKVDGKEQPFNNFSYFQVYHIKNKGFIALFTKYNEWKNRVIGFNTSKDGIHWEEWKVLADIGMGHYQVSAERDGKVCVAFDYHPEGKGLNYRTNLYYLETTDFGKTWKTRSGTKADLPLKTIENPALVHDYTTPGLNCYLLDIALGKKGNPYILIVSSKGFEAGPENAPRKWTLFQYKGKKWEGNVITTSDNNYDMGSIYVESSENIKIIGPAIDGAQLYNPGGEVAVYASNDGGRNWSMEKQLTKESPRNHTYVRRPLNAHEDFYAIWADGHGRKPSESYLYFANSKGEVFRLPRKVSEKFVKPEKY
jgi:rhamnogalacturonyl hydrolase YesR